MTSNLHNAPGPSAGFQPLRGIRVLDLTNVLSGPLACYQLAHMGAEVIKVEPVGHGDLARQLGDHLALNQQNMGASFLAQNAGKKSITLNLKSPEGVQILRDLVATADVLVENFRPGVMDRLGVGPAVLRAHHPALIYCAISGFGQEGPLRARPAYDQIVQGIAGVMSITGEAGGDPLRVGYPVADSIGGLTAAMAICGALNAPVRGCYLDVSMMASVLATMGWAVSNWLSAGTDPRPLGNENATSAPSGAFRCRDGMINITANKQEQWEALARDLDLAHLLEDPRYASRDARKQHRASLLPLVEAALAKEDVAHWADRLSAIGVPAGEVLGVPQVLEHPQTTQRQQLARFPSPLPELDDLRVLRPGVTADGAPLRVETPPPLLGADTHAILAEIGRSPEEIDDLCRRGVV